MSIYDDILVEVSTSESGDDLLVNLSPYFDEAYEEEAYYNALFDIAKYFIKQSYYEFGLIILENLYEIDNQKNIGYEIARTYYSVQAYQQAYNWILEVSPDVLTVKYDMLKGNILWKMGVDNEAVDLFTKIKDAFPTEVQVYFNLASIYDENGIRERAELFYDVYLNYSLRDTIKEKEQVRTSRLKLLQYHLQKEIVSAEEINKLFNHEIGIENPEEFYAFALAYQRIGKLETAIEMAEKAIAKDIDFIDAKLLKIELYEATGKADDITQLIHSLTSSLPLLDDNIVKIAHTALKTGNVTEYLIFKLEAYFQVAEEESERYQIISLIVHYYIENKMNAEALHLLKTSKEEFSDENYLSYLFAITFQALALNDRVEDYYLTALEYSINESDLVFRYASFLTSQDRSNEALELAEDYNHSIYNTADLVSLRNHLRTSMRENYEF